MPPRNSIPFGSEPKSESLEGVLSAIKSLAEVVGKHVSTSGIVKPKDAEIEGSTHPNVIRSVFREIHQVDKCSELLSKWADSIYFLLTEEM
nr:hypothetical protein CFP56_40517 [Quercus suber]